MEKKSTQNIVTALSIIIALIAVSYAVYMKTMTEKSSKMVVASPVSNDHMESVENPVVLKFNGYDVTRSEIINNFEESTSELPNGTDIEQIFPLLQEQYVIGRLLTGAARDVGISGTTPEVAAKIEAAREQALRAVFIEQLTKTKVTDGDVRQAYEDIVVNSPAVMERKASHILLETKEAAQDIISKLRGGADFAELAKESSAGPSGVNGGDLGYFTKGEMVPVFSDAAFSMEIGAFSETPIETQFGFHVVKVVDARERAKPTFDQMKNQLTQQLRQAVISEKIEELRAKADIVTFDFNGNEIATAETEAAPSVTGEVTETEETSESAAADTKPEEAEETVSEN